MHDKKYHLLVTLRAKQGLADELQNELVTLSEASLATPMCTRFEVARSAIDPNVFVLIETFASSDAYPVHVATAHAQEFLTRVVPSLIDERTAIEF